MKLVLLLALLASCATRTPVSDGIKGEGHRISGIKAIKQKDYHCGPAALAVVLRNRNAEELARGLFHERLKGSFYSEIKGRAREEGMTVIELDDLRNAFEEVRNDHPVIVLQNNGFRFLPQWHFSVLTGFDPEGPDVYLADGSGKIVRTDMRLFERSFILGGRRALVILPPGELSATANELAHAEAATILESIGKVPEAELSFEAILQKWPESFLGHVGLANTSYALGKKMKSLQVLERAMEIYPDSKILRHNREYVEKALLKTSSAPAKPRIRSY